MDNERGHPTLEKIAKLKNKFLDPAFAEDVVQIGAWEKDVRALIVREDLAGNAAIMQLFKIFTDETAEMNMLLLNADSKKLTESERDRVLDRKRMYEKFLKLFDEKDIRESIESVDKLVDEELVN